MWWQADQSYMVLQPGTNHGRSITDDNILTIDWDCSENFKAVQEQVSFLTKGYKCRTGCTTARCGCRKTVLCRLYVYKLLKFEQSSWATFCILEQDTAIAEVAFQETVMTPSSETEHCNRGTGFLGRLEALEQWLMTAAVKMSQMMKIHNIFNSYYYTYAV